MTKIGSWWYPTPNNDIDLLSWYLFFVIHHLCPSPRRLAIVELLDAFVCPIEAEMISSTITIHLATSIIGSCICYLMIPNWTTCLKAVLNVHCSNIVIVYIWALPFIRKWRHQIWHLAHCLIRKMEQETQMNDSLPIAASLFASVQSGGKPGDGGWCEV